MKRGDSTHSWKERFFVIRNDEDNYRVDYYDGKDEGGKLKGSIYLSDYEVADFAEEEIASEGRLGIKMVPRTDKEKRRTWYVRMLPTSDEAERQMWKKAFETCCYKAKPPQDPDFAIAKSFTVALNKTRVDLGLGYEKRAFGTEAERLANMVISLVHSKVLDQVIAAIPDGPAKKVATDAITSTVRASINAAVTTAWNAAKAAIEAIRIAVVKIAEAGITPIIEAENRVKERIVSLVTGAARPVIDGLGERFFRPVLARALAPMTNIYVIALKGVHKYLHQEISGGSRGGASFGPFMKEAQHNLLTNWLSGAYITEAYVKCYELDKSPISQVAQLFPASYPVSSLHFAVESAVQDLVRRFCVVFATNAKGHDQAGMLAVLNQTASKLAADCKASIKLTLAGILKAVVSETVEENITGPAKDAVAPVQEMIDQLPGMSILFDLPELLGACVDDIQDRALDEIMEPTIRDISGQIDAAALEVGLEVLAV